MKIRAGRRTNGRRLRFFSGGIFGFPGPIDLVRCLYRFVSAGGGSYVIVSFFSKDNAATRTIVQVGVGPHGGGIGCVLIRLPRSIARAVGGTGAPDRGRVVRGTVSFLARGRGTLGVYRLSGRHVQHTKSAVRTRYGRHGLGSLPSVNFHIFQVTSDGVGSICCDTGRCSRDSLFCFASGVGRSHAKLSLLCNYLAGLKLSLSLPRSRRSVRKCAICSISGARLVTYFTRRVPRGIFHRVTNERPHRIIFHSTSFHSDTSHVGVSRVFGALSPNAAVRVLWARGRSARVGLGFGRRGFRRSTTGTMYSIFNKRPCGAFSCRMRAQGGSKRADFRGFAKFHGRPVMPRLASRVILGRVQSVRHTRRVGPSRTLRKGCGLAVRVRANMNGACACVGAVFRLGGHCN